MKTKQTVDDLTQIVSTKPPNLWLVYQQPHRKYSATFNTTLVFVRANSRAQAIREAQKGDHISPAGEFKRPNAVLITAGLSLYL